MSKPLSLPRPLAAYDIGNEANTRSAIETNDRQIFKHGDVIPATSGGAGTVSGILKGNGAGAVSAAVSGTDFQAPVIAILTADDEILQRKSGALAARTMSDLLSDLGTVGAATKAGVETLTNKTLGATTVTGALTPSQTAGIVGTTTNNDASAGSVGEYISSNVARGAGPSLTSGSATNVTSISLTAGDWDINWYSAFHSGGATTLTQILGGVSSTSGSVPTAPASGAGALAQYPSYFELDAYVDGYTRLSLSATTTIYLGIKPTWSGGSGDGYGFIGARRAR